MNASQLGIRQSPAHHARLKRASSAILGQTRYKILSSVSVCAFECFPQRAPKMSTKMKLSMPCPQAAKKERNAIDFDTRNDGG